MICSSKHTVVLLQTFARITVTTATPERSFSSLRILKTYMRSTVLEEISNGLTMFEMYKHKLNDVDEITNFSRQKSRRMNGLS